MSAWTSVKLFRPGPPPLVTPQSLAAFTGDLADLQIIQDPYPMGSKLKFGRSIDQDDKSTTVREEVNAAICTLRDIDWDAQVSTSSPSELVEWMSGPFHRGRVFRRRIDNPIIYRAVVDLGGLRDDVLWEFSRDNDEANDVGGLFLDGLFVSIEPVVVGDPQSDGPPFMVGWMSVSVGGSGYLWPWTYEELLGKIRSSASLKRVEQLCRSHWPVPPIEVTQEHIENRKLMGHLWGGDDYEAPPDWRWVISETY